MDPVMDPNNIQPTLYSHLGMFVTKPCCYVVLCGLLVIRGKAFTFPQNNDFYILYGKYHKLCHNR